MIKKIVIQTLFNLCVAACLSFIYFNFSLSWFASLISAPESEIPEKIQSFFIENQENLISDRWNFWKNEVLFKGFETESIFTKISFGKQYFSGIGISFFIVFGAFIIKSLLSFFTAVYLLHHQESKLHALIKLLFPIPLLLWICLIVMFFLQIDFPGIQLFYLAVNEFHVRYLFVPILILVMASWPSLTLLMYAGIMDENKIFFQGLKAKGLSFTLKLNHYFSLIKPTIKAYFIQIFPSFFAGSFLIEKTFNLPGAANFIVNAFLTNDIFISSLFVFMSSFLVLTGHFFIRQPRKTHQYRIDEV